MKKLALLTSASSGGAGIAAKRVYSSLLNLKQQDLRIDLPTIGLKTIKQSKTAGLKGIVVKSKQHIFLDKNKCISFADKNKMFISVK